MNTKNSAEEMRTLKDLVREANSKKPETKAGELIAAAEQITGVVNEETGDVEMPGLIREKGALEILAEIRDQLEKTLRSPLDWEEKEAQKQRLMDIEDRIKKVEDAATRPNESRIKRMAS